MVKNFKGVLLLLFILGIAGLPSFFEPVRLVQIQKGDPGLLGVLTRLQIGVVQELGTCFLARADRQDIRALIGSGIPVDVLDLDARGKTYFLLPSLAPSVQKDLGGLGRLAKVEAGTFLFWTEAGDPAAALPPRLPRKPLPTTTILPYLRPALSMEERVLLPQPVNDLVSQIADQISEENLRGLVQALQNFQTRYVSTPNCDAAARFISNYYQGLGLDVRFQDIPYSADAVSRNVIAEAPGHVYPSDVLIICGHYDSISNDRTVFAPGADDNASGAAATMEAARILAAHPVDFT
ncbi:MAG: M28 family peptidase, partial [Candidatus Aminicenantales bacterium]